MRGGAAFCPTLGAAAALALALPHAARAQAATGAVTGAAAGDDGRPLAYARVVLVAAARPDSALRQVLAGADGRFVLAGVAPGRYRVQVRQIGYRPGEAEVAVGDAGAAPVQVRLARVPVALPTAVVRGGPLSCDAPEMRAGRDDPRLVALQDALTENAARYALLVREYPVEVRGARWVWYYTTAGATLKGESDTTTVPLGSKRVYAPGQVVVPKRDSSGRATGSWTVSPPGLESIASDAFRRAHCMAFGGAAEVDGRPAVRLLVAPESHVRGPDVAGEFYLDSATRVLRRSELTLTGLTRDMRSRDVAVTSHYVELAPGLAFRSGGVLSQAFVPGMRGRNVVIDRSAERSGVLAYRFTGQVPPGVAASGTLPAAAQ